MSRYGALQCEMCPFDKIIIIRGVDKTSELNKDKGGGASLVWPKWILWYVPLIRDG